MKSAYPITITKDNKLYVVFIPDLDINTQGISVANAMEMARDAIGMYGCYKQDKKKKYHRRRLCVILTISAIF